MLAVTIRLRDDDPVEPTTIDWIADESRCEHTETMCQVCADSWAMDWDLVEWVIINDTGATIVPWEEQEEDL